MSNRLFESVLDFTLVSPRYFDFSRHLKTTFSVSITRYTSIKKNITVTK